MVGETVTLDVVASQAGLLNAWIDFDGDGVWQPSEQVFTDVTLVAGVNSLTFVVPADATPGDTYARFRFEHRRRAVAHRPGAGWRG